MREGSINIINILNMPAKEALLDLYALPSADMMILLSVFFQRRDRKKVWTERGSGRLGQTETGTN